jgi:hypothetical protein
MLDPEGEGAYIILNVENCLPDTTFNIPEGWLFSSRRVPGPIIPRRSTYSPTTRVESMFALSMGLTVLFFFY